MPASSPPPVSPPAVFAVPGTFFPHLLLDEVMPTLSGSEWVLLCVVVRQTLGWHDLLTGGRKRSDWLSHRQLRARTGRGSDAVCSAVDSLVRRELIEVRDEVGRLLPTPAERRRARRLFYALSPSLHARLGATEGPRADHQEKPKSPAPAAGQIRMQALQLVRQSRFRKAETTKETDTKYRQSSFGKAKSKPSAKARSASNAARLGGEGCGCLRPLAPRPSARPAPAPAGLEPPPPDLAPFLLLYREKLGQRGDGLDGEGGLSSEDGARLRAALDRYGAERLERLTEVFCGSDSALLHYGGYGIGAFLEVLPTLSVLRLKPASPAPSQVLGEGLAAGTEADAKAPRLGE